MTDAPNPAEAMLRYLLWKAGPGPIDIEFKRLGDAVLRPSVSIVTPIGSTPVARSDEQDIARFSLGDEQVARLLCAREELRPPCLVVQCDAFIAMASRRRRWGWSIRLSRDGTPLQGFHLDGRPLAQCRNGFTRARLLSMCEKSGMGHGHDIIGLC
ncbi:MAG: hypothetical protein NTX28_05190 [Novosphingobium sp.]|nr:hypothetical protein [Novosphingobium sp.]